MTTAFPVVNPNGASPPRTTALVIGGAMRGKINAVASVTLTANVTSTTMSDPRLGVYSWIDFDPLTANAAVEKAAGTMYVLEANRSTGTYVITHANNAQTDRKFRALIIG